MKAALGRAAERLAKKKKGAAEIFFFLETRWRRGASRGGIARLENALVDSAVKSE